MAKTISNKSNKVQIDYRTMDLRDGGVFREISARVRKWHEDGIRAMTNENIFEIWQQIEMYVEQMQVPLGATNRVIQDYVKTAVQKGLIDKTKFRTTKDKKGLVTYWVDNKVGQVYDGLNSLLDDVKSSINVENDDYEGNDGIEYGVSNALEKVTKDKKLWQQVRLPCGKLQNKLGLAFSYTGYNPRVNLPNGDIYMKYSHPKDVVVDPSSKKEFFLDANYIFRRERMRVEDAETLFESLGLDTGLVKHNTDKIEGLYYLKSVDKVVPGEYMTVWWVEWKKKYVNKYSLEEMGVDGHVEHEQMHFFEGLYVEKEGLLWYEENKYVDNDDIEAYQFKTVPYYDKHSDTRLHPIGIPEKLLNVQDIWNLLGTLKINNIILKSRLRVMVRERLKKAYGEDVLNGFIFDGSVLEIPESEDSEHSDIRKDFQTVEYPSLPPELEGFLQMVEQSIKDNSLTHESITGEFPQKGNISGIAITKLREANQSKLSYKILNFEWAPTIETKIMYFIIAQEWDEGAFIKVNKKDKDEKGYVPIQTKMNGVEYEEFLARNYSGMDMQAASDEFEEFNQVVFIFPKTDESGMPPDPLFFKENTLVLINMLKDFEKGVFKLSIKVNFEFGSERNKLEDLVWASGLHEREEFPLPILLEMKGGFFKHNKQRILDGIKKERAEKMLATEIMQRGPEFMNIVQQDMQNFDATVNNAQQGGNA